MADDQQSLEELKTQIAELQSSVKGRRKLHIAVAGTTMGLFVSIIAGLSFKYNNAEGLEYSYVPSDQVVQVLVQAGLALVVGGSATTILAKKLQ